MVLRYSASRGSIAEPRRGLKLISPIWGMPCRGAESYQYLQLTRDRLIQHGDRSLPALRIFRMRIETIVIALPFLAATMTAGTLSAQQGPSVDETVEWLNTHKSSITCPNQTTINRQVFVQHWWSRITRTGECSEQDRPPDRTTWSDITSITIGTGTNEEDGRITGHYPIIRMHYKGGGSTISFDEGASHDEVSRFAKALSHLAELNGAKLVKDDLF
jgi:hypothetical protein